MSEQSPEDGTHRVEVIENEPREVTIGLVFSYLIGPLLIIGSVYAFTNGDILIGLSMVLAGILVFPTARYRIEDELNVRFSRRVLIFLSFVLVFGSAYLTDQMAGM